MNRRVQVVRLSVDRSLTEQINRWTEAGWRFLGFVPGAQRGGPQAIFERVTQ